jgi:hypothetical protein
MLSLVVNVLEVVHQHVQPATRQTGDLGIAKLELKKLLHPAATCVMERRHLR